MGPDGSANTLTHEIRIPRILPATAPYGVELSVAFALDGACVGDVVMRGAVPRAEGGSGFNLLVNGGFESSASSIAPWEDAVNPGATSALRTGDGNAGRGMNSVELVSATYEVRSR